MKLVVSLWLVFSIWQASALPKKSSKDSASRLDKRVWNTLKNWYNKAHEWFLGEDGFITTFYYSTGDAPKPKRKCCRRRCCCSCPHRANTHTQDNLAAPGRPGQDVQCFLLGWSCGDQNGIDSNANAGIVTTPPVDSGSGDCCTGCADCCTGCADCCTGCADCCTGCWKDCCNDIDCSGGDDGCLECCCKVFCCCICGLCPCSN